MAVRRRKSKLGRARKRALTKVDRSRRKSYVKKRAKRLRYARAYYRKNKAKVLRKRKNYWKRTKGKALYKQGKPGGRYPRYKRFPYKARGRKRSNRRKKA